MPRGQSIGEAFVTIRPDLSAFTRDLKNGVEQSGKSASDTLKTVITVGAFTVAAKEVIGAASDLQQAVGGTTAVFGESQAAVAEWAKGADEAAGLSERAARQLTSQIGGLLKGFGFAKDEAAATSIELAQIGADLAATFGGTTQEAVEALAAALRGETDPLERFGISLNQAAINAKAMELGLADSATEVTGNAKAQAALALITERSADAQGQFGREADTAAGQLERSKAKIENTAASIGSDLLPVVAQAAELVGFLTEGFAALPQPVQTAALALGAIAIVGPKVGEHLSSLASLSRSARDSLDTLALKAMYARDGLAGAGQAVSGFGSTLTLSNPILLASAAAITGLAAVWVKSQSDAAAAAAAAKDYTAAIEAQTGAVEANVDAAARKRFADNAVGKILADTSANFDIFTKGIQENEDALDAWAENAGGSKLTGGYKNFENSLRDAAKGGNELAAELIRLRDAREISSKDLADVVLQLEKESNAYDSGAEAAARNERVIGDTADTADRAASAAGELSTATDAAKAAFEREQQAAQDAADALDRVLQSTDDLFGAQLSAEEASLATKRALDAYRDSLKDGTKSADDRRQAGIDLLQAFQAEAEAAAAAAQKQADLTGQQFDAGDAAIVQRDKLAELAASLAPDSPLRQQLQGFIDQLQAVIDRKDVQVKVQAIAPGAVPQPAGMSAQDYYLYILGESGLLARGIDGGLYRTDTMERVKATGGSARKGTEYQVAEPGYGPEIYTEGNRTYLIPGADGMVTDARSTAAAMGGSTTWAPVFNITTTDPERATRQALRLMRREAAFAGGR